MARRKAVPASWVQPLVGGRQPAVDHFPRQANLVPAGSLQFVWLGMSLISLMKTHDGWIYQIGQRAGSLCEGRVAQSSDSANPYLVDVNFDSGQVGRPSTRQKPRLSFATFWMKTVSYSVSSSTVLWKLC
jgi:hypothetical protein